jgi:hypothetical protein
MSFFPKPNGKWYLAKGHLSRGSDWFRNGDSLGDEGYEGFQNGLPSDSASITKFTLASRCSYFTTYLFLALILPESKLSFYIIHWLISQAHEDLKRTKPAFLAGTCHQASWFWTTIFGLAAVMSATRANGLELREVQTWRQAFEAHVRLGSHVLGLRDWKSAVAVLKVVGWVEGFDGDEEIRAMWEAAVQSDSASKAL